MSYSLAVSAVHEGNRRGLNAVAAAVIRLFAPLSQTEAKDSECRHVRKPRVVRWMEILTRTSSLTVWPDAADRERHAQWRNDAHHDQGNELDRVFESVHVDELRSS